MHIPLENHTFDDIIVFIENSEESIDNSLKHKIYIEKSIVFLYNSKQVRKSNQNF